ncbi:hypothetical protein B0H11DRAFT_2343009 [Mycena galericulata]|nr:hypothetical protein B0H11DRAFT_2343009 [Mycena galericulata]
MIWKGSFLPSSTASWRLFIEDSGPTLEQIDAVELIGGSTRVPAVRARIQEAFPGKVLDHPEPGQGDRAQGDLLLRHALPRVPRARLPHPGHHPLPHQSAVDASPADPEDDTELLATSGEEKYSHINEDKQSVVEEVATVKKWLDD